MTSKIVAIILAGGVAIAATACGAAAGAERARTATPVASAADWSTCTNRAGGFAVRYPAGWHTASLRPADACRWFDPEPFELVDGTDCCPRALEVHPVPESFDRVAASYTDPRWYRVVAREDVAGERRSLRLWLETTGAGLLDDGTRIYALLLQRGSATIVVQTTAAPGDPRYDEWVRVVDEVARTIEVDDVADDAETVRVFFANEKLQRDRDSCGEVFPRERRVSRAGSPEQRLVAALEQLLRGPREAERANGYGSWFSRETTGMLRGVAILERDVVRVDFHDFSQLMDGANTSCGSAYLLAALNETVRAAVPAAQPVYSFRGDCATFYEWLQGSPPACAPMPAKGRP